MVAHFDINVLLHEVSDFVDKAAAEAMDVEAGCKAGIVGTVPAERKFILASSNPNSTFPASVVVPLFT